MQQIAQDGQPEERSIARVCFVMDFAGQKRESNGQFGTGKKPVGSISEGGKESKNNAGSSSEQKPARRSNYSSLPDNVRKHADEMSNRISSGKAKVRESGMSAHIPNTREYREHAARHIQITGYMPSHFDGDYQQYIPTIQKAFKGKNAVFSRLKSGEISAKIELDTHVGTVYDRNDKKGHSAHAVEVKYSRKNNDWHFYPCDMEDD